ncbi:MAG TPA: hypothetical protein VFU37_05220 [Pyrinomonadaceae bacterium]|nr:hypothetical protein [Pyrinomonadaceae bacterium]
MKQFSLYDILGVLAPGAVLTIGIIALYPDAIKLIPNNDFTLGDLGVVVLISYVMGNLVAALGNLLEMPYWKITGGQHSDLARRRGAKVITAHQLAAVEARLRQAGFLKTEETISGLSIGEWQGMTRQIYAYLDSRKMTQRIDAFNAQYGMNRGIAAGFLTLTLLAAIHSGFVLWKVQLILLICTVLAAYRMQRFSRHYAAELFRQFIVPPESAPPPESAKQAGKET